ncbi:NUDIX hydrolase [Paenibacillus ginsengarvi]|nr:NUDIX domain-containing protein [Paenibacillus ginsengarvi]
MMSDYNYCPLCGGPLAGTYEKGKSYRFCPSGHYTLYPSQSVGAVAVIPDGEGRILLERRAIEPGYGMWALPGGMAEQGESIQACAVREVLEETGLEIEVTKLLDVTGGIRVCTVFYEARLIGGMLTKSAESLELEWFRPEHIPFEQFAFPRHKEQLSRWLNERRTEA